MGKQHAGKQLCMLTPFLRGRVSFSKGVFLLLGTRFVALMAQNKHTHTFDTGVPVQYTDRPQRHTHTYTHTHTNTHTSYVWFAKAIRKDTHTGYIPAVFLAGK